MSFYQYLTCPLSTSIKVAERGFKSNAVGSETVAAACTEIRNASAFCKFPFWSGISPMRNGGS